MTTTRERLLALRAAHPEASNPQLAAMAGCSASSVWRLLGSRRRVLSSDERAHILALREAGKRVAIIARRVGCSEGTVNDVLRQAGRTRGNVAKLPAEAVARMRGMRRTGEKLARIAHEMGCAEATVGRYVRAAGMGGRLDR